MRYAQINSNYVCGIDLHARNMYTCVMNRTGEILFHRNMRTDFDHFKKKMTPFLSDMAVGVESTHMYYWLAYDYPKQMRAYKGFTQTPAPSLTPAGRMLPPYPIAVSSAGYIG